MAKPNWCKHTDCSFLLSSSNAICSGRLLELQQHDGDENTHRLCLFINGNIVDLQVNRTDMWWLIRCCNAIRDDD